MSEQPFIRCMLKEYRRRKGLSQEELARLVSIRRQAVYDMESGRYLPNTAIALKLARVLGCTVEMLFAEEEAERKEPVRLLGEGGTVPSRLGLARIGDALVGVPIQGPGAMPFCLRPAGGVLRQGNRVDLLQSGPELENTVIIFGCDPAITLLHDHLARSVAGAGVHTVFASSRKALQTLAGGSAHIAGTHFHNEDGSHDANLEAVRALLPGQECLVMAFSVQEEGLMVAGGNPLGIKGVADLAETRARFVNREDGAALRKLLDDLFLRQGIPAEAVHGYTAKVQSHHEGAFHVACGSADAALGLRVVAESFGLDFIPLARTRCDLVIPRTMEAHPGVGIVLNILQSARLRKDLQTLAGYDASLTGKVITR